MTAPFLGATFGVGLLLVVGGISGTTPAPRRESAVRPASPRAVLPLALGVGAGVVAFLLTGWLVGGCLAGLAAALVPRAVADAARPAVSVERAEAVATWAEMLRDTMAAAAGLEEAVISSAPVAPLAIRADVKRLATRLERDRLGPSLRAFADDIDDATADLVVAALLLASEYRARNLGALLGALSGSARMEASMVMRVEAGRARLRTAARVVTVTTLGFALLLIAFSRDFLAPYDQPQGQAWLLVVGALFALAIRELGRLSRLTVPPRLLTAGFGDGSGGGHSS